MGRGGVAELVVDDEVDRAADLVALDLRQVERFGNDTLAGEGGVAVHQDRQHGVVAVVGLVHVGPRHADDHGADGLEVGRVGRELGVDRVARRALVRALQTEVVLHVARSLDRALAHGAFELAEELVVGLAHDVDQHIESTPVGHAEHGSAVVGVGGGGQEGVDDRDGRLRPLEAEPLLADVARRQELLESLGGGEPLEDVVLMLTVDRVRMTLDLLLDPALLGRVGDVHVFDADAATVGIAQHAQDVAERHLDRLAADRRVHAVAQAGEELAVEVPDRQAERRRIELGMQDRGRVGQRIGVGDEVAADPVLVDEGVDRHLLGVGALGVVGLGGAMIVEPLHRGVGDTDVVEQFVVEVVDPEQQLVDPLEEGPRLGTLDDPMVVGRGHVDDLRQAQLGDDLLVGGFEGRRVVDAPDPDDRSLPRHEPGNRLHRAEGADVGEADRGPGHVVDRELVVADLLDERLVGRHELGEVHGAGVFDDGHDQ